jgi:hypothetical protein
MTPDQERRIRECAFDEDITYILTELWHWSSDDDSFDGLAQCLEDIRSILSEDA